MINLASVEHWASPKRYHDDDIVKQCLRCGCAVYLHDGDPRKTYVCVPCGEAIQEAEAMICTCQEPRPLTRPSGKVICVNPGCGLPIIAKRVVEERP